ncbi:neutral ceramidase 2-like [Tripterygium wilfordii]|uniref:neutral ceramidase 2-like n=1 Tax=Tripterygium wilfordii TaxID=458696 RepID=UPI0018F822BE|nr:neutral ceramidase 2-like [Tripterygium wilfordii]
MDHTHTINNLVADQHVQCQNMNNSKMHRDPQLVLSFVIILCFSFAFLRANGYYLIGVGSYDMTGPAAGVNMMGYANMDQVTAGIHFRLRARTFIVAENAQGGARFAFVNLDAGMASQLVTIKVLERIKSRFGDLYTEENVAISGIHTHAGPGGYLQYMVYSVTSLGFVQQSFDAIVSAIEQSIVQAHENLKPGSIFINKGDVENAGINRSPSAYLFNPAEERARYKDNVDKEMTLLKFVDGGSRNSIGAFSWHATHGTSMSRDNKLISGDNKGAAARFFEDWFPSTTKPSSTSINKDIVKLQEKAETIRGTGGQKCEKTASQSFKVRKTDKCPFVGAFCQSNVGDVSPNVLGAFCTDSGKPCDFNRSSCNGNDQLCVGRGPGYPDEVISTKMIAERQLKKAIELFESAKEQLSGKIDYRHVYLNFTDLTVDLGNNMVTTCPAALGPGFAAGTTDGPGAFGFQQGDTEVWAVCHSSLWPNIELGSNLTFNGPVADCLLGNSPCLQINNLWKQVRDLLKEPSPYQVDCQKPKLVLLSTGEMFEPYAWAPAILPIQMLRLGNFVILSVPGEFTTMAGRRLRDAVKETLISNGGGEFDNETHVVIAGLTNTYSQYVTTFEEYKQQRYEAASTLYGPHTLSAYIQEFRKLATTMAKGEKNTPSGISPPDLSSNQLSLVLPPFGDSPPPGKKFGDIAQDVIPPKGGSFKKGDRPSATFWSANPRYDLLTEGTFAGVEILQEQRWIPVYDDDDFSLYFKWRVEDITFYGTATIEWQVPDNASPGVYRLRHFGSSKQTVVSPIEYFTGASSAFTVS